MKEERSLRRKEMEKKKRNVENWISKKEDSWNKHEDDTKKEYIDKKRRRNKMKSEEAKEEMITEIKRRQHKDEGR